MQLDLDLNLKLGVSSLYGGLDLDLNLTLALSFQSSCAIDLDLNLKLGVSFQSSCAARSRSESKVGPYHSVLT